MKAKLIMKSKSRKSDRVKNRVKTTKPALGEGFMQLLADRTGYVRPLYLQENQLFNFSVDFLVDSMSWGGLFLPGFVQVDDKK